MRERREKHAARFARTGTELTARKTRDEEGRQRRWATARDHRARDGLLAPSIGDGRRQLSRRTLHVRARSLARSPASSRETTRGRARAGSVESLEPRAKGKERAAKGVATRDTRISECMNSATRVSLLAGGRVPLPGSTRPRGIDATRARAGKWGPTTRPLSAVPAPLRHPGVASANADARARAAARGVLKQRLLCAGAPGREGYANAYPGQTRESEEGKKEPPSQSSSRVYTGKRSARAGVEREERTSGGSGVGTTVDRSFGKRSSATPRALVT